MGATKTVDGNLVDSEYWKTEEMMECKLRWILGT
jgi:hypothetical protein